MTCLKSQLVSSRTGAWTQVSSFPFSCFARAKRQNAPGILLSCHRQNLGNLDEWLVNVPVTPSVSITNVFSKVFMHLVTESVNKSL